MEEVITTDQKLDIILDQINKLTLMTVDAIIRTTAIEEVLFESKMLTPNDYKTKIDRISDEFSNNVDLMMKRLQEGSDGV
jgi:hypothetical protein